MPRMTPTLTGVALGAGAGWLRNKDVASGRVTLSGQWGTYLEAGAALTGILADMMRLPVSREVSDTLYAGGLALFSERMTRSALSTGGFGTGAPRAISGGSYASAAPMMYTPGSGRGWGGQGFAQKERSATVF